MPKLTVPVIILLLVTILFSTGGGQCHNQCSGHGECNAQGQCECWSGFEGWDCSSHTCPSGPAWADIASGTDDAHKDAVCSNMGYCDGETGLCICRGGFAGRACERMSCPKDCNGHGKCMSMAEAAAAEDGNRLIHVSSYVGWDAGMIFGCICDDDYEGYDCSLRPCPLSDSGLTSGQQDESVVLYCRCGGDCANTFRLRYKGQYATISPSMIAEEVADGIMALSSVKSDAAEYTTPPVVVAFAGSESTVCSSGGTATTITFARDPGDLPPVFIKFDRLTSSTGTDVHMTTEATLQCTCTGVCGGYFRFVGYRGAATEKLPFDAGATTIQTTLAALADLASATITVTIGSVTDAVCQDSATVSTTIAVDLDYGNYPLKVVHSLLDGLPPLQGDDLMMTLSTNDGEKEQEYCAGLGTCDFETGQCTCDEDYAYDQEYGPCGQYVVGHSHWPGRQMCPGFVLRPSFVGLGGERNDWNLYFTDGGSDYNDPSTEDTQFDSTVLLPGFYWHNEYRDIEEPEEDIRVMFADADDETTGISNALALDMTYRVLYYGQNNQVMRMPLPSDLTEAELLDAVDDTADSPVETFITLAVGESAGYLEMDLRPDHRYLYWTVPGVDSTADGKVLRKQLSDASGPTVYEDLSSVIRAGMITLGYDLVDPLGIALDLREEKMYFVDAQVRGATGGEDGVVIRCNLDGTEVEIAAYQGMSDPRALALDVNLAVMYLTDTHVPSIMKGNMRDYSGDGLTTLVGGVIQQRRGAIDIEDYYQPLINPQALQLDSRQEDLDILYFSDYATGYIYSIATDGEDSDAISETAQTVVRMGEPKSFIFDFGEGYPTFTLFYDCHGHGVCSGAPYFTCSCDDGWEGNCAQRSCPKGPAWFDEATTDGAAHAPAECSARGICDRETGVCECDDGFTGDACQRMRCPNDCNGNGKCLSMRQLGLLALDADYVPSPVTYGSIAGNPLTWDADAVFGCYCDWMGYQGGGPSYTNLSDWTGYDCSRRSCPTGDDSKAAVFSATEFEEQHLTCTLDVGFDVMSQAAFSISFRQGTTDPLTAGTSTLSDLEAALESLSTIGDIEVSMDGYDSASHDSALLCSSSGGQPASILFKTELGDLPPLSITHVSTDLSGVVTVQIDEETKGTKLDAECSRHGRCDSAEGECVCFEGWASSDGDGAVGHRRDCGWSPGEAGAVKTVHSSSTSTSSVV